MARPTKQRRVCAVPVRSSFVPEVQNEVAGQVMMAVEEYEVVRLIDYLGFTQRDCAVQMNVARTTVQAIYDSARQKIADAIVNGKRLEIRGGNYVVCKRGTRCCGMNCRTRCWEGNRCNNGEYGCCNCPMEEE